MLTVPRPYIYFKLFRHYVVDERHPEHENDPASVMEELGDERGVGYGRILYVCTIRMRGYLAQYRWREPCHATRAIGRGKF